MTRNRINDTAGHVYMRRALQLSLAGEPRVSPNPMVGAVIVARDRIIGEGYHRCFGEAHAEVNAINSVKDADRHLLREATIYVTLEPCSHFGKTPPCADLIIATGIPKAVIAIEDPFLKDYESGIEKMRKAGIEVEVGLMREEALWINRRFFTAHTLKRPFVLLKWAQSCDGYIAAADGLPVRLSNDFTLMLMHRERAIYDAIMVGTNTVINDNPRLSCRFWPCRDNDSRPLKVTFDSPRILTEAEIMKGNHVLKAESETLNDFLKRLYGEHKVTSLMVEGGAETLKSFMEDSMIPVDEIRIENSSVSIGNGIAAPDVEKFYREAGLARGDSKKYFGNTITYFVKNY